MNGQWAWIQPKRPTKFHILLKGVENFQVGHDFVKFMEKYATDGLDVETKDIMTKYGLEVIASAGFGIEAKAFNDPDGIFSDRVAR